MRNLFKLNQIFLFLVTILLVNGFIHPIPAWSAGEDPFQTEPITDDLGRSVGAIIQNYDRVINYITSLTRGIAALDYQPPLSRDATVHGGDNSVTITGATRTPDFNVFAITFWDEVSGGRTYAVYEQRGSEMDFTYQTLDPDGAWGKSDTDRSWETKRTTTLSFNPDGSRVTDDGSFKIGSNGDFEITLSLEKTFDFSKVIFGVVNGYGANAAVFDRVNPTTAEPSNFAPIQQSDTSFSPVSD